MGIKLYNADCLPAMREMGDNEFELAIVDPPFGIKKRMQGSDPLGNMSKNIDWNLTTPNKDYFSELIRVSENQIIWGANYYANYLPNERDWIVWDKLQAEKIGYSMHELAWTSFDKSPKIIRICTIRQNRIHPCQKPVKLYRWLLENYAKPGDKILDTHLGSASIACACHDMNFDLVGYELDKDYYEAACKRLKEHQSQMMLF